MSVIDAGAVTVNGAVATSGKLRMSAGTAVEIDTAAITGPEPPVGDDEVGSVSSTRTTRSSWSTSPPGWSYILERATEQARS